MSKTLESNRADRQNSDSVTAATKMALAVLGIGLVAGTTIVIGMDKIMESKGMLMFAENGKRCEIVTTIAEDGCVVD